MRRKLRVTVTKIRRLSSMQENQLSHGPCLVCAREVELLTKGHAAGVLEVTLPALDAFISAGSIHAVETVSGAIKICKNSLFVSTQPAKA